MSEARKLVVTENVSANGVIEFLDPWFGPGEDGDNADQLAALMEQSAAEDALLLGRKTFEEFRSYWPQQHDDRTGISAHLDQVPKYVYSATVTDPAWQHSSVVSGDLTARVRELKVTTELPRRGGGIGVTGSIALVHALLGADLVDELRLFVHPVLTSNGRNLVPPGLSMQSWRLAGSCSFRAGVVLSTYVRG